MDPEDLIPKLPKPKDLQPFPTTQSLVRPGPAPSVLAPPTRSGPAPSQQLMLFVCGPQVYRGHGSLVRSISVSPTGQWLASGETRARPCTCTPMHVHVHRPLCVFRQRRRDREVLGGVLCPLPEDGPGGRGCEERRLEPEPVRLSAGGGAVRPRPLLAVPSLSASLKVVPFQGLCGPRPGAPPGGQTRPVSVGATPGSSCGRGEGGGGACRLERV